MTTNLIDTTALAERCARLYAALTAKQPSADTEYTALVLDTVCAAMGREKHAGYPDVLEEFVTANRDALTALLRDYGPASSSDKAPTGWGDKPYLLVHSPAVLAVCERLYTKPMWLEAAWGERWESDTPLEDLRNAWGSR